MTKMIEPSIHDMNRYYQSLDIRSPSVDGIPRGIDVSDIVLSQYEDTQYTKDDIEYGDILSFKYIPSDHKSFSVVEHELNLNPLIIFCGMSVSNNTTYFHGVNMKLCQYLNLPYTRLVDRYQKSFYDYTQTPPLLKIPMSNVNRGMTSFIYDNLERSYSLGKKTIPKVFKSYKVDNISGCKLINISEMDTELLVSNIKLKSISQRGM